MILIFLHLLEKRNPILQTSHHNRHICRRPKTGCGKAKPMAPWEQPLALSLSSLPHHFPVVGHAGERLTQTQVVPSQV